MPFAKSKRYYQKLLRFFTFDIWNVDNMAEGNGSSWGIRYLKILLITIRSVSDHKVGLLAAALTFFSLVAIVPFIAVVYAITKGFGFAKELESLIFANFSEQEEVVQWVLKFANNLLDTNKSGLFGIIGFITFLWSVVWVMISVEQTFNHIWQVKNDKSIARKALVYIGIIILSPILMGGLLLAPLSYNTFIQSIGLDIKFFSTLAPFVAKLMHFLSLCILFFAAYKLIPSAKIGIIPALYAALFTTTAFMCVQMLYWETQIFVVRLNAVYGAFAAIPFFMFWMQINWLLILLGAELSYAFQNFKSYQYNGNKIII